MLLRSTVLASILGWTLLLTACHTPRTSALRDGTTPAAAVGSSAVPKAADPKQHPPESPEGIRVVNLKDFLEKHLGELNPELSDLATDCGADQEPIRFLARMQYGDLDGDGQEEAVAQGLSCMSGTYGEDFYGVLKLMPDRTITVLPIDATRPKVFKGQDPQEGLRGKLFWSIEGNKLTEQYPVYADGDPNAEPSRGTRKFVFRWNGQQFVLDDIIDVPPEKSGS